MKFKKLISCIASGTLACVIAGSAFVSAVDIKGFPENTFPIVEENHPVMTLGQVVDYEFGSKRLSTNKPDKNGVDFSVAAKMMYYDGLRDVRFELKSSLSGDKKEDVDFTIRPHTNIGSSVKILNKGIDAKTTENGILMLVDTTEYKTKSDSKDEFHVADLGFEYNEFDVDKNNNLLTNSEGANVLTKRALSNDKEVTLLWSKDCDITYKEKDENGNETEVIQKRKKDDKDHILIKDNKISFPRNFEGYVLIPFNAFETKDGTSDVNGLVDFRKIDSFVIKEEFTSKVTAPLLLDNLYFYGPAFKTVSSDAGSNEEDEYDTPRPIPEQSFDEQPSQTSQPSQSQSDSKSDGVSSVAIAVIIVVAIVIICGSIFGFFIIKNKKQKNNQKQKSNKTKSNKRNK